MNVLVACEESQTVCKAFRKKGHNAFSCDLIECSGGHPEWHIKGNALDYINDNWDLIIAHPPCTYLSKAGARWLYRNGKINENRLIQLLKARDLFFEFYNCNCEKICIENPTPLRIANLPNPSQVIEPYEFGHPYSKRTLLWLKGLPPLMPTYILADYEPYLPSNTSNFAKGFGGSNGIAHNAKIASKTFEGIATAMADQWG